jgi:uncharacterized protein (TIGR03083 family)
VEHRDHLAALSGAVLELRRIAQRVPAAQLLTPVAGCPGWTVADVFGHLGSIERWTTGILAGGKPEPSQPWPAGNPVPWFLAGTEDFQARLHAVDPSSECWTMGQPRTAAFWSRRQVHEHTVHLWDVVQALTPALGAPHAGDGVLPEALLPSALAVDGVDEVFSVFVPRQLKRGLMSLPPAAVSFSVSASPVSADSLSSRSVSAGATAAFVPKHHWVVGEGPPAATVTADARTLYLGLWGRLDLGGHAVLHGEAAAARAVLAMPLVP